MALFAVIIMWPSGRGPPSVSTGMGNHFAGSEESSSGSARRCRAHFGSKAVYQQLGLLAGPKREPRLNIRG